MNFTSTCQITVTPQRLARCSYFSKSICIITTSMPIDRRQSDKATIKGYFHEFPSAHVLLDITCKIAVTPQRSVAFSSSRTGTCTSTRSTRLCGQQNGKSTTNRVFVNIHVLVHAAVNVATDPAACSILFRLEMAERQHSTIQKSIWRSLVVWNSKPRGAFSLA